MNIERSRRKKEGKIGEGREIGEGNEHGFDS